MISQRAHWDWDEIRHFYEAGHSSAECRKRFGFGGSSWDQAVKRGDIRPRRGGQGLVNEERREAVLALVGEGLPRVEVARRLGVSISTVAYYVRRLELDIDVRCARRYDWTEVQRFHDKGHSTRECMERFGFSYRPGTKRGAEAFCGLVLPVPLSRLISSRGERSAVGISSGGCSPRG